jgi:fimbrial chaperone protein
MHRDRASTARWPLAVLAVLACTTAAAKGHLQARPTLVELAPQAAAGRLILANSGDAPVAAQVRVFSWDQVDGDDRLTPATDVVLSPPIASIPAGAEQVVRLVRTGPPATGHDRTYRLVVDELPGNPAAPNTAVSVRLQYVLPLFVRADGAAPPALACRVLAATLRCVNSGGQPAQLGRSQLVDGGGHALPLSAGLFGYVLPGRERRWALEASRLASLDGPLRLETQLNGQSVRVDLARTP